MAGHVVTVTNLDSVRIEVLGEGRAVSIPASLILAVDHVLRHCAIREVNLNVSTVQNDDADEANWIAITDSGVDATGDMAASPWSAIANLAVELEGRR